jgi:hypothetical protein
VCAAIVALALAAAGGSLALAAKTRHERVRAVAGATAATLSFDYAPKRPISSFRDLHLTIVRHGRTTYSKAVRNRACGAICWPQQGDILHVLDVEGDGEPDVLLNLYTGGAHCCYVTEVYRYDAQRRSYDALLHIWGDPGYALKRLDGSKPYEFLTYDDRFAYEFAPYAYSGLPREILRLRDRRFVDVTRSYPQLVAPDARRLWRYYLEGRSDGTGLGFLAAWAADEYNLGHASAVDRTLDWLERDGELRSQEPRTWPGGAKFVTRLDAFLRKSGYGSAQ